MAIEGRTPTPHDDKLVLELVEPGVGVDAADLLSIWADTLRVLDEIDRAVVGEENDIQWRVTSMSVNSPARMELTSVPRKVKNRSHSPQSVAIDRLQVLASGRGGRGGRRLPRGANAPLSRIKKKLDSVDGRALKVSGGAADETVTVRITAKTLGQYIENGMVKLPVTGYFAPTTEVGTLAIVKFTVPRSFSLENPLTGEAVECRVGPDLFDEAVALGGRRVEVAAIAAYDKADRMTRLDVQDIREMPDDDDLPSFDDLPRLSGKVSPFAAADLLDVRGTW